MYNPDGIRELANAIIVRASRDYLEACKTLKRNPNHAMAIYTKAECLRFFHSRWFSILTNANPNYIIESLNKEINNE